MEKKKFKSFAEQLVLKAGKVLLDHQKSVRIVKYKDIQDIATSADFASERFIIESIQKKYPDFSIFSEEKGEIDRKSDYKWLIDPLDGTKAFVRNMTHYSSNICLTYKGEPIVSAMYYPAFNRLYSAAKGLGSFVNGKRTKLSKIVELKKAYVYFYSPTRNREYINYEKSWNSIKKLADVSYRVLSEQNVSLGCAFLANGGMEAYVNLSNPSRWHDLAPGLLIARESGAIVNTNDYPLVVANNEKIYNELVKIIK